MPPSLLLRFFRWYCHPKFVERIEGDLWEEYHERVGRNGKFKADIRFVIDVLLLCRPGIIKSINKSRFQVNPYDMFRHNLLISMRSFYRHRSSFFINLLGLSSGMACVLLIYLWAGDELGVDKYNEKDNQLYQVMQNFHRTDIQTIEGTQGLLANALAQEMPEVEYAASVVPPHWFSGKGMVSIGDSHIKASPQFVSKDYFNVFSCKIVQGDIRNPLPDVNSVAISEDLALRLFNTTSNIIGKVLHWNHQDFTDDYHITGVFKNIPTNATAPFDLLFNFDAFVLKRKWELNWSNCDPSTFLVLKKGTDINSFNNKISGFIKSKDLNANSTLFVQKLSDRYLNGRYENGVPVGGRIYYVRLISIIGLFILIIACINFMNLSTAKATRRAKEIGVKKSMGASRAALIWQYFSESALVSFMSLLIAIAIVFFLVPQFNTLTAKNISMEFNSSLAIGLVGIFFLTSALAGSYPALYLSGLKSIEIVKGKISTATGEFLARKGLVVFQFAISVFLIVGVLVVYKQMEYIQNKNLGYNKENMITFEMEGLPPEKLESFRTEIKKISGILNAGTFGHNLTGDHGNIELDWDGKTSDQHMSFANIEVGVDFIETMGIEFKEGHSPTMNGKPESQIVLNESAIQFMQMKDPIGKKVRYWGFESEIVGVTKDFHFESLHEPIKPSFFRVYPVAPFFIVKIVGGTEINTIQRIEQLYHSFAPGLPFEYKFLDENYNKLYASEQRVTVLSRYFAGIAIVISCLGLFGLATFTAERRVKEIGIRKVLGSSEFGIVYLLTSEFTKAVLVSIFIALPISYITSNYWLNGFAFKIGLEWWYFIGSGLFALFTAWLTVGTQAFRAAKANPVDSLKVD